MNVLDKAEMDQIREAVSEANGPPSICHGDYIDEAEGGVRYHLVQFRFEDKTVMQSEPVYKKSPGTNRPLDPEKDFRGYASYGEEANISIQPALKGRKIVISRGESYRRNMKFDSVILPSDADHEDVVKEVLRLAAL